MKTQRTRVGAYALIVEGNRILLCRLSSQVPRWAGFWTLPGGGVEFAEHPNSTVEREVLEETGLVVRATRVAGVDSFADLSGTEERHSIRIIYHTTVVSGDLKAEVSGTTDGCAWFTREAVDAIPKVDLVRTAISLL